MQHTATYSPEDNKLRLYPACRLDSDEYARVKAAGFKWAPKQELFVAPAWSPGREDLLIEFCDEIGDEDTSLVDRAEAKADRLKTLSDKRRHDAEAAHAAVESICEHIPLGQPILVGHHSEKRARKDAERIQNGMRKSVRMWDLAEYWKDRAAGALQHAKYKELPAVRHRRIKGLEADLRKVQKSIKEIENFLAMWRKDGLTLERAKAIANFDHVSACFPLDKYPRELPASQYEGQMGLWSALDGGVITAEQARDIAVRVHERYLPTARRWVEHYENRLTYERAMLAEAGGIEADRTKPEKGGAVRCWASHRGGWSYVVRVNKVSVTVLDNWGNGGKNFTRTIEFDKLTAVMTVAAVQAKRDAGVLVEFEDKTGFALLDAPPPKTKPKPEEPPEADKFEAMKDTLRNGVKVVAAPNLFPTPPEIADQVCSLAFSQTAGPVPTLRVLEPSAGTGALIRAAQRWDRLDITAIEINQSLAEALGAESLQQVKAGGRGFTVTCADFLQCNGDLGQFDRVVMNPPFDHGSDITHIEHALTMLKPGGRLVAICANGPRQREKLMPRATEWIDLPAGSFSQAGTEVNAAIVVIDNNQTTSEDLTMQTKTKAPHRGGKKDTPQAKSAIRKPRPAVRPKAVSKSPEVASQAIGPAPVSATPAPSEAADESLMRSNVPATIPGGRAESVSDIPAQVRSEAVSGPLTARYKPERLAGIFGQHGAVKALQSFAASPYPAAFVFHGPSGVGKTAAAWAMAGELGCDPDWGGVVEIPSGSQDGAAVRELLRSLSLRPLGGSGWKVAIVNEADRMTEQAEATWLDGLERLPPRTVVIFTTNTLRRMSARFVRRCEVVEFDATSETFREGMEQLVRIIWQAETGRELHAIPDGLGKLELADDSYSIGFALQQIAPYVRIGEELPEKFHVPFIRGSSPTVTTPKDPRPATASPTSAPATIPISSALVPAPHRAYCPHCKTWICKGDPVKRTDEGKLRHAAC